VQGRAGRRPFKLIHFNEAMLEKLHIRNYAIIEEIPIGFSGKLNVITGETGAGKSILMGALSLILGERADASVLMDREKKCVVEGLFSRETRKGVDAFFAENGLDGEEEILIRREIGANGKSRAFVNDSPVNLVQLRRLSSLLVDLHQQFDELELGESGFQREVLDALAGHQELLYQYQSLYGHYSGLKKQWAGLSGQKAQFNKEYDYNQFLYDELKEASFRENELEELDMELRLLSNTEQVKACLTSACEGLSAGERPITQQLKSILGQLQGFEIYLPALSALVERLHSAQVELKDIGSELESLNDHLLADPSRMEQINERIALGYKLLKKHGLRTTAELREIQSALEMKLKAVLDLDERIAVLERESSRLFEEARRLASIVSTNRQLHVRLLEEKVNQLLNRVGMPAARLKVELSRTELNEFGMDRIEFLFDANRSGRFEPVAKVASGGELSRLMLCIKSLVAQSMDLPTLIFDEIDSGISGEAAKQVGLILQELSRNRQVICITHQAQIAGRGDSHYFVYKEGRAGSIRTGIRLLKTDERIRVIANMLSGENPTAAALENAREMIVQK
jgi:DNA repair protein RecN (Recombination protein N)